MNHVENALMITRKVNRRYETSDDTAALTAMLEANVKATVALAEQQRLANLIALAKIAGETDRYNEGLTEAAYGALNALITTKSVPNGHIDPYEVEVLRTDVADALGIEQ